MLCVITTLFYIMNTYTVYSQDVPSLYGIQATCIYQDGYPNTCQTLKIIIKI